MAQRERRFDESYGEMEFKMIEYALLALAKFKKTEDIKIIKESLLRNNWEMTYLSFRLMREFPDEAYLDVYEKYYRWYFYRIICRGQQASKADYFMNSIATYKNERSAHILKSILNKNPFMPCSTNTSDLKKELVYAIWNNKCKSYSEMTRQIEKAVKIYEKKQRDFERTQQGLIPPEHQIFPPDTSAEPIRGW
jgi:hypothetical protein